MAWIESHQNLADHPKTRKLARILNISKPTVIGHLHCLWWWALDYADDGNLDRFDPLDIAIGAEWEGDPDEFLQALIRAGFVDAEEEHFEIHDWEDYAGKLIDRRRANAKRMREARARQSDDEIDSDSARAENVQRTQRARVERPTKPTNQTKPNRTKQATTGADAPSSPDPKPKTDTPYGILQALCNEQGQDVSVFSGRDKDRQLAVAKRLIESDMTAEKVVRITRWLKSQKWVTGGVDLFLIEKQVGKWRLAGEPEIEKASLTVHPGGKPSIQERNDAAFDQVGRELFGDDWQRDISDSPDVIDIPYRRAR